MIFDWVLVLAIRFLLFDYKFFQSLRDWVWKRGSVFQYLLKCGFCQGFWIALILESIAPVRATGWDLIVFPLTSGIVAYTWILWAYTRIEEAEEMSLVIHDPDHREKESSYENIHQI